MGNELKYKIGNPSIESALIERTSRSDNNTTDTLAVYDQIIL